jgi:uncharacterized membrane protein YGL010W
MMMGERTNEEWIAHYATSHRNPVNRFLHTIGIPMIVVSIALFIGSLVAHSLFPFAAAFFIIGWIFQFVGHAFEHKAPEFFHDWRFLFVGVRWWWAKVRGKA